VVRECVSPRFCVEPDLVGLNNWLFRAFPVFSGGDRATRLSRRGGALPRSVYSIT